MPELLTHAQQNTLLHLARDAIRIYLETGKNKKVREKEAPFSTPRGAFVTLKKGDKLRGCIGRIIADQPLDRVVIEMAVAAATQDYRFSPISSEDLSDINIEISVLSPPKAAADPSQIRVGRDGIIVSQGGRSGVLLPQVPVEWGWDRETYLNHGCLKAGLDETAWKRGARIETFTAQVFSETAPGG